MNILLVASLYVAAALFAWRITGWVRRYALNRMILDYPNQRSLHSVPTPRGGGISISLSVVICAVLLWVVELLPIQIMMAVVGGGLIVAIVGWLDDNFNISIVWRAVSYLLSSLWACFWIFNGDARFEGYEIINYIIWMFAISWMTNLYNFMDGSDGLAASQAVCTGLMASLLLSDQAGLSILLIVLGGACSGFLIWNWPPAKIFMGDVGSCVIGFIFGAMALVTWANGTLSLAVWLIMLSIFISDSSLTLAKRILSGDKWYQAHRKHGYQLIVQGGTSHKHLVYLILFINILFILPLSYVATQSRDYEWFITAGVYILLGSLWLFIQLKYRGPGTE